MAVSFVASTPTTAKTTIAGGTLAISKPASVAVGDILQICVGVYYSGGAVVSVLVPGFTAVDSNARDATSQVGLYLLQRVADGTEASTFTITVAPSADLMFAICARTTGTSGGDVHTNGSTTTGTTGVFPSVTTTAANDGVILWGFGSWGGTPTGSQWDNAFPSGTTGIGATSNDTGNLLYLSAAYFTQATAGATGTKSVPTPTNAAGTPFKSVVASYIPSGGGGTNVNLVAAASSGATTALSASDSKALASAASTAGTGNVIASESSALGSISATGVPGTIVPSASSNVAGTSATGAGGALIVSDAISIAMAQTTGGAGTFASSLGVSLVAAVSAGTVGSFAKSASAALAPASTAGAASPFTASDAATLAGAASTGATASISSAESSALAIAAGTAATQPFSPSTSALLATGATSGTTGGFAIASSFSVFAAAALGFVAGFASRNDFPLAAGRSNGDASSISIDFAVTPPSATATGAASNFAGREAPLLSASASGRVAEFVSTLTIRLDPVASFGAVEDFRAAGPVPPRLEAWSYGTINGGPEFSSGAIDANLASSEGAIVPVASAVGAITSPFALSEGAMDPSVVTSSGTFV